MTDYKLVPKRCAACGNEKPVSEMQTCMHHQMHRYVCDSKCMNDFYNPPKNPISDAAAPAVQGELVEAAAAALDEIEAIMHEAYNSAEPVCCGRGGAGGCCGSPEPEWSESAHKTIARLSPHQRALTAALAPYRKGAQP